MAVLAIRLTTKMLIVVILIIITQSISNFKITLLSSIRSFQDYY